MRFGVVSPADKDAEPAIEAVWMCENCHDWCSKEMPDTNFREIVTEMVELPDDELRAALGLPLADPDGDGHHDVHDQLPMKLTSGEEVGYLIEESFDLVTFSEFEKKAKQTPAAIGAKAVRKRNPSTGKIEVRYALPMPGRPRPVLKVYTKMKVEVKKPRTKEGMTTKFKNHADMAFRGFVSKVIGATGVGRLSRFAQTFDEIVKKATGSGAPAASATAASAPGSGCFALEEQIEKVRQARLELALEEEPDENAQESGGSNEDIVPVVTEKVVVLGMPIAQVPPKRNQSFAASPLGTAMHWIERSPLSDVLLGADCKRELYQLRLIKGSTGSSTTQIDNAERHMKLLEDAAELQPNSLMGLTRKRKDELVKALEDDNTTWPVYTQLWLIHYDVVDLFQAIYQMSDPDPSLYKLCDILKVGGSKSNLKLPHPVLLLLVLLLLLFLLLLLLLLYSLPIHLFPEPSIWAHPRCTFPGTSTIILNATRYTRYTLHAPHHNSTFHTPHTHYTTYV